jgi:hypothetical protein
VAFDAAAFDATSAHPAHATVFTDLPRIHERYLIYLVPFFLVALFAVFGLRRPTFLGLRPLVGAAVVAALLPALIPFGTVMNGTAAIDSFALQLFGDTRHGQTVPFTHATTLIVALSALLAAVFVLAATELLPPMAAVMVTALSFVALSALEIGHQVTPIGPATAGVPAQPEWVDRVVGTGANVTLVGGAGVPAAPLRETAFWNTSIARVYFTCRQALGSDFGEQQLSGGSAISTRYAVVPASMPVTGRVLARDRVGKLVLIAPADGTLRIPSSLGCRS